jgi:hypothetical protein
VKTADTTERSSLTEAQERQLASLTGEPGTTLIPEAPADNWQQARRRPHDPD